MNDEYSDKIQGNLAAIENSRDWLVQEGGVVSRVHKMGAEHVSLLADVSTWLNSIRNFKRQKPNTIWTT